MTESETRSETEASHSESAAEVPCPGDPDQDITPWDEHAYKLLTAIDLTPEQERQITRPYKICPRETDILAIHWHPETVPVSLAEKRLTHMFPHSVNELVIPTQHNEVLSYKGFSGVEIDSHSPEFHRKVQLLLHFREDRLRNSHTLNAMILHTRKYRQTQLYELLDAILEPKYAAVLRKAEDATGSGEDVTVFLQIFARKLKQMLERHFSTTPEFHIKNKLLSYYLNMLREFYDAHTVHRALILLQEIKSIVKRNFELEYFYKTQEIIEEVRAIGGGIVIPHPEQFWPVLLCDYDVDGIEVWNPQSREYTEFLIQVILRKNRSEQYRHRPLLIMTGDDTHLGEKLLPPEYQHPEKTKREVGYQPVWDEAPIRKTLSLGGVTKERVIQEYRSRLSG